MKKRMNKRGQDLSIGTLILIVLGIVVLVLLILGFTLGWENLWEKISIFGGTASIGDVVTACRLAQTSQDTYTLCEKTWEVRVDGEETTLGCRDSRVTASLGESNFGCNQNYNLIIKKATGTATCEEFGGEKILTGDVSEADFECPEANSEKRTSGYSDDEENAVCCIAP